MSGPPLLPLSDIRSYHAHIYFDGEAEFVFAMELRQAIAARFPVTMGGVHLRTVGPHSLPMYQVAFEKELFGAIVPWLALNHGDLSVLIHLNTEFPVRDHLRTALWLGTPLKVFDERLAGTTPILDIGLPNTVPTVAA